MPSGVCVIYSMIMRSRRMCPEGNGLSTRDDRKIDLIEDRHYVPENKGLRFARSSITYWYDPTRANNRLTYQRALSREIGI